MKVGRLPVVDPLIDQATPAGAQPSWSSGKSLVVSEEFGGSMTVTDAALGMVRFRDNGPQWATWYPNWPRFNAQSPGGNHTNTNQGAYYATSKVSLDGAGSLLLRCDQEQSVAGLAYTAGMIQSLGFFTPLYGSFEARIRIERRSGLWPAFWSSASAFDQWPPEIDFWEYFGNGVGGNSTFLTNTYLPGQGAPTYSFETSVPEIQDWHTYGCEWAPGMVRFYTDGVLTNQTTQSPSAAMYMILNNGMTGTFGTPFASGNMWVDWLRFWG